MSRFVRWGAAGLATVSAFGVSAWVCGALVLPPLVRSAGDRWGLAAGLGVAVAALAALWGSQWAGRDVTDEDAGGKAADERGSSRSITIRGDNKGIASTGDNSTNIQAP
jgi:hypothetical protein